MIYNVVLVSAVGLQFFNYIFSCNILDRFWYKVMIASYDELRYVLSFSVIWENLWRLILFLSYILIEFTGKASSAWSFLWGKALNYTFNFIYSYRTIQVFYFFLCQFFHQNFQIFYIKL